MLLLLPAAFAWAGAKPSKALAGYPADADVRILTDDGSAVGPLDRLRVRGKYTAFDVYADWCAPCKLIDKHLREVVTRRKDVAVRKLNVVEFSSPLARELGGDFDSLPFVVVFGPDGSRSEIVGADLEKLDKALGVSAPEAP